MIHSIAVIGVGRMGGGIARNLAQARAFDVTVSDVNDAAVAACVDAGATRAQSIGEAVAKADLVITSLPLPETVLTVYRENVTASPAGAIWMDVSTIDPATAVVVEREVEDVNRRFVACPLGKGPAQAESGELPLFVGGHEDLVAELADVFACIGASTHHLGSVAAATCFKTVSNMVGMANLAVLAEGLTLCRASGVSDVAFEDALRNTGAWSAQADIRLPWMMAGDFENRFAVDLAVKDVRLAVDQAARLGVPVPLGAAGLMQLVTAHARGWGREDVDAVLKLTRHETKKQ